MSEKFAADAHRERGAGKPKDDKMVDGRNFVRISQRLPDRSKSENPQNEPDHDKPRREIEKALEKIRPGEVRHENKIVLPTPKIKIFPIAKITKEAE